MVAFEVVSPRGSERSHRPEEIASRRPSRECRSLTGLSQTKSSGPERSSFVGTEKLRNMKLNRKNAEDNNPTTNKRVRKYIDSKPRASEGQKANVHQNLKKSNKEAQNSSTKSVSSNLSTKTEFATSRPPKIGSKRHGPTRRKAQIRLTSGIKIARQIRTEEKPRPTRHEKSESRKANKTAKQPRQMPKRGYNKSDLETQEEKDYRSSRSTPLLSSDRSTKKKAHGVGRRTDDDLIEKTAEEAEKIEEGQELVLDERVMAIPQKGEKGGNNKKKKNKVMLRALLVPPDVKLPDDVEIPASDSGKPENDKIPSSHTKPSRNSSSHSKMSSNSKSTQELPKSKQHLSTLQGKSKISAENSKQSFAEVEKRSDAEKKLSRIPNGRQSREMKSKEHDVPNKRCGTQVFKHITARAVKQHKSTKGGISFKKRADGAILISKIVNQGLFSESPLEVGDEVLQINNVICRGKTTKDAANVVRDAKGEIKILARRVQVPMAAEVVSSTLPYYSVSVTKKSISSKSGLEVQVDTNGRVLVSKIHANGLFASTALQSGDEIISINSIECKGMRPRQIASLFDKVEGAITVWGKRGSKSEQEMSLTSTGGVDGDRMEDAVDVVVQSIFPNSSVKLTKITTSAGFGLQLKRKADGRLVVARIRDSPDKSLPSAALQAGDEILTVNSVDCQGMEVKEVAGLFGRKDGAITVLAKRVEEGDNMVRKEESNNLSTKSEEIVDESKGESTFFVSCCNMAADARDDNNDAETYYTAFTGRSSGIYNEAESKINRSVGAGGCDFFSDPGNEARDGFDGAESTFTSHTVGTSVYPESPARADKLSERGHLYSHGDLTDSIANHRDGDKESENTGYPSNGVLYSL